MQLRVITKTELKRTGFAGENIEELCGPAAIAMLLWANGSDIAISDVIRLMRQGGAYIPGTGTILSKVPRCVGSGLFSIPYVPTWLLLVMLRRGYRCVHSVRHAIGEGGHIVFVSDYKENEVHVYDPNIDGVEPVRIGLKDWRARSNHRAVFMKVVNM